MTMTSRKQESHQPSTRDKTPQERTLPFYASRHTFRPVADEAKDQPAADCIMGHEVAHMSRVYRVTIGDARPRAVADLVHRWLFPSAAFLQIIEVVGRVTGSE
jgi:hypothetical protein